MSICACIWVHMRMCIDVYVYVCMYVCICVCVWVHACKHAGVKVCVRVHGCICICVYACIGYACVSVSMDDFMSVLGVITHPKHPCTQGFFGQVGSWPLWRPG